jgi:integrase
LVPAPADIRQWSADGGTVSARHGHPRRLRQHASPWLLRLIIAALETGMRRGELLSLTWLDVSLSRNEITVRAENTKNNETRIVPISMNLRAVLQLIEHDPAGQRHKPTAYVFADAVGARCATPKNRGCGPVRPQ